MKHEYTLKVKVLLPQFCSLGKVNSV